MSKPQDYEYKEVVIRNGKVDPLVPTLSSMALEGWEPIYTQYVCETWWQHPGRYHLLRRLRPEVPHA